MKPMKWDERIRNQKGPGGPTLTKQAFKKECDVNTIMKRFEKSGLLDHVNTHEGAYGDYTNFPQDYQACVNQVMGAKEMFDTIPAKIRARFGNDPGVFLGFATDPANKAEMIELGLVKPDQTPAEQLGKAGAQAEALAEAGQMDLEGKIAAELDRRDKAKEGSGETK